MSKRPWHKRYHSDALTGYRGLSLELRGAYTTILDLLYDSGDIALPASERWMAGQLDVSTRKWRAIRDELVAAEKIVVMDDGRVTNGRYLRELGKFRDLSEKRATAGSAGGKARAAKVQGEFGSFSDPENTHENDLSGKDKSDEHDAKPAENSQSGQAIAKANTPLRARDLEARVQNHTPSQPNNPTVGPEPAEPVGVGPGDEKSVLDDGDLMDWYQAIAQASGHSPASPGPISRAMKFVEAWRKDGIPLESLILPTIRAVISETREPTRTLGRFDARIRHEHARLAATPKGRAYRPPPSPILEPVGEDPKFRPLRADLLERLTPPIYSMFANAARFEDLGEYPGDRIVMRVVDDRAPGLQLMNGAHASTVRAVAKKHGWTDVW